jgi:hypothetical protein
VCPQPGDLGQLWLLAQQRLQGADNCPVTKWLSLRNLLVLVLLLWNGYFLAALIYELFVQSPSRSTVIAVIVWLWVLGDLAILLGSWALRAILRARHSAA